MRVIPSARRRWLLVAGGIAALCSLPVLIGVLPVSAPAISPAALRNKVLAPRAPYAGYAESNGSLGLPDLPETGDLAGLLGGRTRLRVWHASTRRARLDVITPTGERAYYTTPAGATVWDYERDVTTDLIGEPDLRLPRAADLNPPDLAARLLGGRRGAESLDTLPARRVAGVSAAGLRLTPTDPDSTIGTVDMWVDAVTGLTLRVQVTGRDGGPPSLTTRFLQVDQGDGVAPDSVVSPPYPPGAERAVAKVPQVSAFVDRNAPMALPDTLAGRRASRLITGSGSGSALRSYGPGFTTFAVAALPAGLGRQALEAARSGGARAVPLDAEAGIGQAVLLRTPLVNLVVAVGATGGYVLAGPVRPNLLVAAAQELVEQSLTFGFDCEGPGCRRQ